ncbi:hypothetical protein vBSenS3_74 [Salmonella phage vB_SenS-3]|nr:hypothetical protein vBSenS3_74 [Salmonella phage vB_SenS-3]
MQLPCKHLNRVRFLVGAPNLKIHLPSLLFLVIIFI